ncbi:MAG: hypothetical protein AB1632_14805 [Nitrospirota bacterium]
MREKIFKRSILSSLLTIVLILFFEIGLTNGEITYRSVEPDNNAKAFEINDFLEFGHKSFIFVDMEKKPLLIIPDDQITNMSLSYKTCVDISGVAVRIDINDVFSKKFDGFTANLFEKKIAIFINGDFIGAPTIREPLEESFAFGPVSYEKAAAIIINSGFTPNYEETCVGGKTKIIDITKKYKFKENYAHKQNNYPSILNNSEFWYLKEETPIYDGPGGNIIMRMPAKKIVEQYYNPESKEFEKKGDWLKIIYQGEARWIKAVNIIPFFSILNTNLFLQKFFVYNEYRYEGSIEDKHMYSNYLIQRVRSIRKLYIEEARSRFKDENEFKRWYFDTFQKSYED